MKKKNKEVPPPHPKNKKPNQYLTSNRGAQRVQDSSNRRISTFAPSKADITQLWNSSYKKIKKKNFSTEIQKNKATQYQCGARPIASARRLPFDRCKVAL